jgi:CBS domain-containing protein
MQISVRDLMSTRPVTISASTTLHEATRILLERALDAICVCDDQGRLLGSVSDYELLKSRLLNTDNEQPIETIVSCSIMTLGPEMLLEDVAGYFRDSCRQRTPVLEDGRLIGELQRRDVLRALIVKSEATRPTLRIEDAEPTPAAPTMSDQPMLSIASEPVDE